MNGFQADLFLEIDGMSRRQERIIRRMVILSVAAHIATLLLGSYWSAMFPSRVFSPPMMVELTDAPVSELPEEPPPPAPVASSARPESVRASSSPSASTRTATKVPPDAKRWLDKLDTGMANVPEAPVTRREGKTGGIAVRHWTNDGPARPGDFAPAIAPERSVAFGKHLGELEARVRGSGRPGVGFGKETEASMMFGGTGDADGEPIPAWIREMIRKRVRDRLPELEGIYTDAIRRNPDLGGKLSVRFRIGSSGKVQSAEPADGSIPDPAFVNAILAKVRQWTFDPPAGRTVEVLYPFVFVAPS